MIDQKLRNRFADAIVAGDAAEVERLVRSDPQLLSTRGFSGGGTALHSAARYGHIPVLEQLVSSGADVNAREERFPNRPLHKACASGELEAARWLLNHGADVNAGQSEGAPTPIITPVIRNRDDIVRLLIERGANVNATYRDSDGLLHSPLTLSIERGYSEIQKLLRDHGAVEIGSVQKSDSLAHAITAHLSQQVGQAEPDAQAETVPSGMPIAIHRISSSQQRPWTVLFTVGLSAQPLKVPEESCSTARAELVIRLAPDWPMRRQELAQSRFQWPYRWLRNLARELHSQGEQVPGWTIVSNGEPPSAISEDTDISCFLITASDELGEVVTKSGNVCFFDVFPIYHAERDLALHRGLAELIKRFEAAQISPIADLARPDVTRV